MKWYNVYKVTRQGSGEAVAVFYCPFCHELHWADGSTFCGCSRVKSNLVVHGLSSHAYFHADGDILGKFAVEKGKIIASWGDVECLHGEHTMESILHYT